MRPFAYHRASSIEGAIYLARTNGASCFLAGGMSLIPTLKLQLVSPANVIDLDRLDDLRFIRNQGGTLAIGALTSHDAVTCSPVVQGAIPALAFLTGTIGDPQVRNRGTIGGALATNDPAGDYPAATVALNATVVTDRRQIAADDFFRGRFATALEADELITRIDFPRPRRAGYARLEQQASRYPLVGVMVAETATGPRVTVIGASSCVFRWTALEQSLSRRWSIDAAKGIAIDIDRLTDDIHGSAEYRAYLVEVLAGRALSAAG